MGESEPEKQVVYMGFVGEERWASFHYAFGEYPYRIEYGDEHYREHHKFRIGGIERERSHTCIQVYELKAEERYYVTEHQRPAVSHEHLEPHASGVVEEECHHTSEQADAKHSIGVQIVIVEPAREHAQRYGSQPGTQPVHSVDEVIGIDRTHNHMAAATTCTKNLLL